VSQLQTWSILENAFVACENDRIVALGPMSELEEAQVTAATLVLHAGGRVVMRGLVECHTHLIFGGSRAHKYRDCPAEIECATW
jgi:imidazolonepropionase